MKRKRIALTVTGVLIFVGLGLWAYAPTYVRAQIHKRHPEVSFADLDIGWRKVTLHQVTIDKGWIKVTADTATIDTKTEHVHLMMGTVEADLDKRPEHTGGKSEQPNVTAAGFTVTLTSAKHDAQATLHEVSVLEDAIRAIDADVRYKGYHLTMGSPGGPEDTGMIAVFVTRDLSKVEFGYVNFPDGLPMPPPMLEIVHPGITGVTIDVEKRTVDVQDASAELAEDQSVFARIEGGHFSLDGDLVHARLDTLYVAHPRLSVGGPISLQHVDFEVGRDLKRPFDLTINGATVFVDPEAESISGNESCSAWVGALPRELAPPPISGKTQWGVQPKLSSMSFSLGLLPKPHFTLSGNCSATCDDPALVALKHHFTYQTYNDKGEPNAEKRATGPDDSDWVPLSQISENMADAVANMEDWGFWSHHGYVGAALEQSFLEDVKSDKFARGGSTITMQTAKNIFLTRDKTIGRKVSELFLSQVLESCFTKKQIMELYLNVVEFGPNIYGLRQAAAHYFKTEPGQLNPQEAFYLAWILPRPRKSPPPTGATLARVTALMQMLAKNGRITEAQMLSISPPDTSGWTQP